MNKKALITILLLSVFTLPVMANNPADCYFDSDGDKYCYVDSKSDRSRQHNKKYSRYNHDNNYRQQHYQQHNPYVLPYYQPQPIMPNNNYGFGCSMPWQCR